jgi:hypothetical protein
MSSLTLETEDCSSVSASFGRKNFRLSENFEALPRAARRPRPSPKTRRDVARELEPGGADRDRTDDLRLAKPALSQLSYSPGLVGQGRVELPTSRLSGVRSNHLSYWPGGGQSYWPGGGRSYWPDEEFLIGASVIGLTERTSALHEERPNPNLGPSKLSPITNCRSLEQPSDVLLALP